MRLTIFALMISVLQTLALDSFSQQERVSVNVENASMSEIFSIIENQTTLSFMYKDSDVVSFNNLSLKIDKTAVKTVLENLFKDKNLDYVFVDNVVVIKPSKKIMTQKVITLEGVVKDDKGQALPGVTVVVKGTSLGVSTDVDGKFKLEVPKKDKIVLVVSFIGMKTQEVVYNGQESIKITMLPDTQEMEEVVVTGFFERKKSTFTGSAKTVSGDELRKISSSNLLRSISIVDPAVVIQENNTQGSNPNHIPEIIIRGTSSINASNEAGANSPLIVIDGVESNLRALYDMDIFDIESVTVLKDASATALYGEQASNGVILITRKKSSQKEVRVTYNFSGSVSFPDLSDYSLMNSRQKLELERFAGLYDSSTGEKDLEYNERLARVNSGIDTDWISKPLRTSFSQNHSFNVTGRGSGMSYGISGRYGNTTGVMKDDSRKNADIGVFFSYNHNQKLIVTLRADYKQTDVKDSRYGSFATYTRANPYDAPYKRDGSLVKELSWGMENPLYEASLSSFGKSRTKSLITSLDLRWNIKPGLYVTAAGNIQNDESKSDNFKSPNSYEFVDVTNPAEKGEYKVSTSNNSSFYFKGALNYNKNLDGLGSMISVNLGGEVRKNEFDPYSFKAQGFFDDRLTALTFATQFPAGTKPEGTPTESSSIAGFAATNIVYRNRYFVEGSYRMSGSSKFGKDKRYAPFWSVGAGWNLHKEAFLDYDWIDILRLRTSYGHTGSINFSPNQAITTYKYGQDLVNLYGYGASPITMGNEDLKWQTTKSINLGLTSTFFNSRLNVNVDVYKKKTVDMIVPISMPASTGVTEVNRNIGEQDNEGFEVTVSGMLIKKKDINWRLSLNASQNKTTLIDIGNTLRKQNDENASSVSVSPLRMFVEGESPTMIYVVRSAGIDPATGKEIYIKKDGSYTYTYDPKDKVAVGDETPKLRGTLSSYLTYKRLTLGINMTYSLGGYIYNSSRVSRIEQIDPRYNADSRAFTERWKKPGDVVKYLTLDLGAKNTHHSSRFVEKENYLSATTITLNYECPTSWAKKLGFKRLRLGMDINDAFRLSTVAQERGLSYPFARGFSFTVSPTF